MADEEDVREGEPDPNAPAPGEEEEGNEEEQQPTVEELAAKAGWVPKDQFRGDPEKWRPAHDYLLVGKETVSKLGRKLNDMESTMSRMTQVSESFYQERLQEQEARLLAQRREAIEAGDVETVDTIDKQRDTLKQRYNGANGKPAELTQFERENEWLGKDKRATSLAVTVCDENQHLPVAEQLRLAREEVHRRFPEYAPKQVKEQAQVNQPDSRTSGKRSGKKGFNDLPPEAQKAARHFEDTHGIAKDEYAKRFFAKQEKAA